MGVGVRAAVGAVARRMGRVAALVGRVTLGALAVVARVEVERPPNWPSGVMTLSRAYPLAREGFPVVWVPDEQTLSAVLSATSREERQQVLLENTDTALAHAHEVLDEVTCPHLHEWRDLIRQSVECVLLHPAPAPAQALALQGAAIVAMDLHGASNLGQVFAEARRAARAGPIPASGALRHDLTTVVFQTVLARFNVGDVVPATPNRHVIAHVLSREQYTLANAIEATLLAVSVLRQTQAEHQGRPCGLAGLDTPEDETIIQGA